MKRVVGALNPKLDGFEASCFDGDYITGDVSAADFDAIAAQRSAAGRRGRGRTTASRLALQSAAEAELMADKKIPRVELPADARLDTLAVREGLPPSAVGRELRGAVPHQQLRAARRGHRRGALRQRGRGLHLLALHQPDGDDDRAPPGRARRHRGLHRHLQRHERDPAARHGPAEGRRPRGLLAERVRLDDHAVRPRVREVRRRDHASSRRPTSAQWRARSSRTRSCCSPRRRPIR